MHVALLLKDGPKTNKSMDPKHALSTGIQEKDIHPSINKKDHMGVLF
jgi:hypothetical protein